MADYGGNAYGAGGAGTEFNPAEFFRRIDVILRIVGWVFAIVVFGCISSQGWVSTGCVYNGSSGACGFGTFVGVMAFLCLMGFLAAAFLFGRLSNVRHREWIVMAEVVVSGIFSFFYFVSFCYLTNQWAATPGKEKKNVSGAQAAIAFSFFSIIVFIALTVLAVKKYRMGVSDVFQSDYNPDFYRESTPAPYAGGTSAYQGGAPTASPFSTTEGNPGAAPGGGYQQQTY